MRAVVIAMQSDWVVYSAIECSTLLDQRQAKSSIDVINRPILEVLSWIAGILGFLLTLWLFLSSSPESVKPAVASDSQQFIKNVTNKNIANNSYNVSAVEPLQAIPPDQKRYSDELLGRPSIQFVLQKGEATTSGSISGSISGQPLDSSQSEIKPSAYPSAITSIAPDIFRKNAIGGSAELKTPRLSSGASGNVANYVLNVMYAGPDAPAPVFNPVAEVLQFALSRGVESTETKYAKEKLDLSIGLINLQKLSEANQVLRELLPNIPANELGLALYARVLLSYINRVPFRLEFRDRISIAIYRTSYKEGKIVISYVNSRDGNLVGLSDTFVDDDSNVSIETHESGFTFIRDTRMSNGCGAVFLFHIGTDWQPVKECPN